MKIIIISTCFTKTPPEKYGGLEYIAYLLAKKIAELDIETYLVASSDSPTPEETKSKYNLIKTLPTGHGEHSMYDVLKDNFLAKNIIEVDSETVFIDMSHKKYMYRYKQQHPEINLIGSIHDYMPFGTAPPVRYPCFVGISKHQSFAIAKQLGVHVEVAYNGVDVDQYPLYTGKRDNYLLFISRMTKEKAPHEAIFIANSLNMPLILAGSDSPMFCDPIYVHSIISKSDGKRITYLGEVSQDKKVELMQKAKCVLLPILFPEPFGLVAVESMLCGTPVIALNNGAYREIIIEKEGGFVCRTVNDMAKAVLSINELSTEKIRENGLLFSVSNMVDIFSTINMANRYFELAQKCITNPW